MLRSYLDNSQRKYICFHNILGKWVTVFICFGNIFLKKSYFFNSKLDL